MAQENTSVPHHQWYQTGASAINPGGNTTYPVNYPYTFGTMAGTTNPNQNMEWKLDQLIALMTKVAERMDDIAGRVDNLVDVLTR